MIGLDRRERIEELAQLLEDDTRADGARRDLRHLAHLAGQLREQIELPTLSTVSREAIRERVLAEIHAPAPEPVRQRAARSTRVVVASGVAALMVGTSGVAVASQHALPGETLYGVKKTTESVRLALAGNPLDTGRVELDLARERLEEVTRGADRVRPDDLVGALQEMDRRSVEGSENLVRMAERDADPTYLVEVLNFTEEQAAGIVAVFNDLPPQIRPYAEDSLSTLRRIRVELLVPAIEACDCADVLAAAVAGCLVCAGADELLELLSSGGLLPAPSAEPSTADEDATDLVADGDTDDAGTDRDLRSGVDSVRTGARTVVPELPGPLEQMGRAVNDVVGSVKDTTGRIVEGTTGTVGKIVENTGDAVDDLLDDPLGSVGGTVEGIVDGIDGVLPPGQN